MTSFLARKTAECQTERRDEFPTHSEGYRKTGTGLLAARRRPAAGWASHEGGLLALGENLYSVVAIPRTAFAQAPSNSCRSAFPGTVFG